MFKIIKSAVGQFLKGTHSIPNHYVSTSSCFSTLLSSKDSGLNNGSLCKNLTTGTPMKPFLSVNDLKVHLTRNVTKFSLKTGKKKSVGAVLSRFYRLECGLWIRRRAGCHKRLHKKGDIGRHIAEQHVVCTKTQCLMLDAMITDHWKKKKYFLDDPFEPYKVRNNFDWVQLKRRPHLVLLAFSGSVGMTLLVLGCALPQYSNWYPFFVIIFYLLSPLPILISRRYRDDMSTSNACHELALFITTGIIISAFGLPIVLAEAPTSNPVIDWGACGLVLSGNVVVFLTIFGFFVAFDNDDVDYSMW